MGERGGGELAREELETGGCGPVQRFLTRLHRKHSVFQRLTPRGEGGHDGAEAVAEM